MTIESCQAFCTTNDYALSGVEYASQCFCSNSIAEGSTGGQSGCDMACTGEASEACGGSSRLNIFNNTAYVYPVTPLEVQGYAYVGCFDELNGERLLPQASYVTGTGMTVESCVGFCNENGLAVAGLEYGTSISRPNCFFPFGIPKKRRKLINRQAKNATARPRSPAQQFQHQVVVVICFVWGMIRSFVVLVTYCRYMCRSSRGFRRGEV